MPRALGQIDRRKNEAILDAAAEVLAERGLSAPLEEVARRAGVSKQTVYNHYGSKTALVRTLVERRRSLLTASLDEAGTGDSPEAALRGYARALLQALVAPGSVNLIRLAVGGANDMPEFARTIFEAGSEAMQARLAAFLQAENDAGRLRVDNPEEAAELFMGMIRGNLMLKLLIGLDVSMSAEDLDRRAEACASSFMRAYRA